MELEEEVWSVLLRVSGTEMELGYCLSWTADEKNYFIKEGFQMCYLTSPFGTIKCRDVWTSPFILPKKHHTFRLVRTEPWMSLDSTDINSVMKFCTEFSEKLPEKGFKRRTDII